jgi:glutamate racemase
MSNHSIGVFDSGFGGISVLRELRSILPNNNFVYVADSGNCPYGDKKPEFILERSNAITQFLINKGCRLIVVACNTATAHAIAYLRQNYTVPFVGMEPALKPAALNTKTGVVGVLATQGTFKGEHFKNTSQKYGKGINTEIQPGDGLVELVESNSVASSEAEVLVGKYIKPMLAKNADHIVLGCTHYPFLIPIIRKIVGEEVVIVDPAPAVARHAKNVLNELNGEEGVESARGKVVYYTSGNPSPMITFLENIGEGKVEVNKLII